MLTYDQLQTEKEGNLKFRQRRHDQWTENYQLYRDKVITNRLTQRQSVNVPLMKATLKTLMAEFSKTTNVYFDELDNDKQKELFLNEYWRWNCDQNRMSIKERVDDLQVLLYGRSFQKLNIVDGAPKIEIIDPFDVLVDRYMDPSDIETAQSIIHTGIFRRMGDIQNNPLYDKSAVASLQKLYATRAGLVKAEDTYGRMRDREDRLRSMGDSERAFPELSETYVELNEFQRKEWNDKTKKTEVIVYATADNEILMQKPLNQILNIDFYPWESWASDVERTDFWSDGEADVTRVPNKTLNVWYSQMVENRTLRSYGMNFYDSTVEGFAPETFQPSPWGFYPVPGNPKDVLQHIEIPDLGESISEMEYVTGLVEQATAATAIEKGNSAEHHITLGEVQFLASKAMSRVEGIFSLRLQNRLALADKWGKLVNANPDKIDAVKLWKKSSKGNLYTKNVGPKDWKSAAGYTCRVVNETEHDNEAISGLNKMFIARQLFPGNSEFDKLMKERSLDVVGFSLDEKQQVMDADKQAMAQLQGMGGPPGSMPSPQGEPPPGVPGIPPQMAAHA